MKLIHYNNENPASKVHAIGGHSKMIVSRAKQQDLVKQFAASVRGLLHLVDKSSRTHQRTTMLKSGAATVIVIF